ncbi:MAG: DnaB-like helicase C-terminal domain-containing protein [Myxococcota bacterium]
MSTLKTLHSLRDEEYVLTGPMWHASEMAEVVAAGIEPREFYSSANGAIFSLMRERYQRGQPVDRAAVRGSLTTVKNVEKYGGWAHIESLLGTMPEGSAADAARRVRAYAARRQAQTLARWLLRVSEMGTEHGDLAEETAVILDKLQRATIELSGRTRASEVLHIGEVGRAWFASQAAFDEGRAAPATSTGIGMLDDTLAGGLYPGDLVTVAGRPGMGKTSLACTIAVNMAQQGHAVGVISLEMPPAQIFAKLAAPFGGVPYGRMRSHDLGGMRGPIEQAANGVCALPLYLIKGARTIESISAAARRLEAMAHQDGYPLRALVIDYLGLLKDESGSAGRYEQVSKNARGLKEMAVDRELGVMMLSQLNRKVEDSKDKVPNISHLRDSGEVEEASDAILLAFRPEYYWEDRQPGLLELIVGKNRHGNTRTLDLNWIGSQGAVLDGPYNPMRQRGVMR